MSSFFFPYKKCGINQKPIKQNSFNRLNTASMRVKFKNRITKVMTFQILMTTRLINFLPIKNLCMRNELIGTF
jgi:hypothetical protein